MAGLCLSPRQTFILQQTAFVTVATVLGILAWLGYALTITPPKPHRGEIEKRSPESLGEIEKTAQHNP
jgi:predicted DNA-binding transcriptional regulator